MGATESKKWLELMSETPTKPEHKALQKVQALEDPRSPTCANMPRTPIQLQTYQESPQNLELKIPDPRSPTSLIERTPLSFPAKKNASSKAEQQKEADSKAEESTAPTLSVEEPKSIVTEPPPTPVSPGAPLTRKDRVSLLKQTVSPADSRRKKRASQSRRQTVQQKLFSESIAPAPRSPLAQRNSVGSTEGNEGKKGRKTSTSRKQRPFQFEELGAGKENARTPVVY